MMMVTFILLATLVMILLIVSDFSWSHVLNTQRNLLVFEGRNHDYGAFVHRKENHRNVMWALLFSVGLVGGGLTVLQLATGRPAALPVENDLSFTICDLPLVDTREKDQVTDESPADNDERLERGNPPTGEDNSPPEIVETGPVQTLAAQDQLSDKPLGGEGDLTAPRGDNGPRDSGEGGNDDSGKTEEKIEVYLPVMPEFPGGLTAMRKFFVKNLEYSEDARRREKEGTVWVAFIISETGKVLSVQLKKGFDDCESLNKNALAAVKKMPDWIPGTDGKNPKPVWMTLPVKFVLE